MAVRWPHSIHLTFLEWLQQQARALELDRILFVSRDGFMLHARHQSGAAHPVESVYLRGSRVAFTLAGMNEDNFPSHIPFLLSGSEGIRVTDLFQRIGVPLPDERVLSDIGLPCDTLLTKENREQAAQLLSALEPSILRVARECRRGLFHHLLSLGLEADMQVGFVDVGWNGTTQLAFAEAIKDMLPMHVHGLYLGASMPASRLARHKGLSLSVFAEAVGATQKESQALYDNRAVVELFFSAPQHTNIGYRELPDGSLYCVEDPGRDNNPELNAIVQAINTGIDEFCQYMDKSSITGLDAQCGRLALSNLLELVATPSEEQAALLGSVHGWDAWASTTTLPQYLAHSTTNGTPQRAALWPAGELALKHPRGARQNNEAS